MKTVTVVIGVIVCALGTVKKRMVENIKKVLKAATVTEIQKVCMLGLQESSERCLVYEQNVCLYLLMSKVHGLGPDDAKRTPVETVIEEMKKMVCDFKKRAESVGHQSLTKEVVKYTEEYCQQRKLRYPDLAWVTEKGRGYTQRED